MGRRGPNSRCYGSLLSKKFRLFKLILRLCIKLNLQKITRKNKK